LIAGIFFPTPVSKLLIIDLSIKLKVFDNLKIQEKVSSAVGNGGRTEIELSKAIAFSITGLRIRPKLKYIKQRSARRKY